jgi:hypothetical protein
MGGFAVCHARPESLVKHTVLARGEFGFGQPFLVGDNGHFISAIEHAFCEFWPLPDGFGSHAVAE